MSPRIVWLVYWKELLETLRDRRTLIVMVILPLALYPLIGVGLTQWVVTRETARIAEASRVGLRGAAWPDLQQALRRADRVDLRGGGAPEDVREGRLDALVEVLPDGAAVWREGTVRLRLFFDGARDRSVLAQDRVQAALRTFAEEQRRQRMVSRGLPVTLLDPVRTEPQNLASKRQVTTQVLAGVLPLIIILMVLLGAFYPAIDLTAGEKERGTLETLFVTPAARLDLIGGKFLAVTTIAIATGLLNLTSIALTAMLGFGPALRAAGLGEVPASAAALTLVALLPTALFFAALMLAVASLARSFKEAQNVLTPVYVACVIPAMASQIPGLELTHFTALVPVANVALLTRDLIAGRFSWPPLVLALISTLLYAGLALRIAARIYNSERMLFIPERAKRRDALPRRGAPEPVEAALVLLAVMALILLVGQPLQARSLFAGILVTEWLLIAAPVLLLVRFGGIEWRRGLHLRRPRVAHVAGALLGGVSAWYLVGALVERLQERVLPMPPELLREMQRMLFSSDRPLALDLFALALSPAICEELLFRGLLLRASWPSLRMPAAVLLNGVLFGLFHLSIYRFFSTFLLGVMLALIVIRCGSILPAMLFHFLNNAAALVVGRMAGGTSPGGDPKLHPAWLAGAALLFLVGVLLIVRGRPADERGSTG